MGKEGKGRREESYHNCRGEMRKYEIENDDKERDDWQRNTNTKR